MLFVDFRFSYEHKINPSHGLKAEVSYKPSFTDYTDATNINLGHKPTGWCYRNTADWYYLSLGYRYYFNNKKTIYVSPEIFCKVMAADSIIYTYGVASGELNTYEIRSMHTVMGGLNLLIGKKIRFRSSGKVIAGFDMFAGLSVRLKDIKTTLYGSTSIAHYHDSYPSVVYIPFYDTPADTRSHSLQVSGQFGVILFLSWK